MAKNKLSHEIEGEYQNGIETVKIVITGSQRQPTVVEAINYISDHERDREGLWVVPMLINGEYLLPEGCKTLTLYQYNDCCPICGHLHDLGGEKCPVCLRKWSDE